MISKNHSKGMLNPKLDNKTLTIRPLRLLSYDESSGKYHLCEEGIDFLSRQKKPFDIYAVVGAYRSGKSSILNHLIEHLCPSARYEGFEVGHTTNSCTKGIFVMNHVF